MNNIIKLDNNCYIEKLSQTTSINSKTIDITKLNLITALKNEKIILEIDFAKIDKKDYKKLLKKLLFINNLSSKIINKFPLNSEGKKLIAYVINFDENNFDQKDFIYGINAIFYKNRYERYNYIYDTVCNYLDNCFYSKNLCEFKDNKCGEKRNATSTTGCCNHFKHKALGPFSKLVLCEYLNKENYTCTAKCISCKLFTCDYLEKKGIKFRIKDILLLNVFFNPIQKYFIKYMVFTPKEKIMKTLMKF